MRKLAMGITTLLYLTLQNGFSEAVITAQDYAVDSDVFLESIVREIKSVPRDLNEVGDEIKLEADEAMIAAKGLAAVLKSTPAEKEERAGILEVANAWDSSNDILFRSYKVTDPVGQELMQGTEFADGSTVDVSDFFTGIDFPEKTSVYFRPEFNRLFVRQTLANILAIEDVLAEQHSAVRDLLGKQISIEAKFIEVNQSTLNELGFSWTFDSKYGDGAPIFGNLTVPANTDLLTDGLRTAASALGAGVASDTLTLAKTTGSLRWSLVINALEQSDDTDVLSAPSLVTRDGNTASILVGEERTVSTGFEVNQSESSLYIQHDLESQLMGVSLEVTPTLRSEDDLIDLDIHPKVIELIGYDSYDATPDNAEMYVWGGWDAAEQKDGANSGAAPSNYIEFLVSPWSVFPFFDEDSGAVDVPQLSSRMPYYRLREVETQLTVDDGSTVGMGGLIYDKLETYKDKVPLLGSIPLLGRLFRSEGEKSVKRNLLIFVTATQVDINGRKVSDLARNP